MFKKLILFLGLLLCGGLTFAQDFPAKSTTLVTDFTSTLASDQKDALERKLVAYNDSSSVQIAVVILKSVGGYDITQYGTMLIRKWGIGQKGKDNGVLILVAIEDHKVAIATGYGAEGPVPDGATHDIIANTISPNFKRGAYYAGLDAAADDIIKLTKGEYKADAQTKKARKHSSSSSSGSPIGFSVIIIIFILVLVFRNRGGGGGGGHIIGSRGGASSFWWFLAGSALGRSSNSGSDWGGFSGGGGGSSGGGGGFGGFGGGSAGGGGSSGSW